MNETEKKVLKESVLKTVNALFDNEEIHVSTIIKIDRVGYGINSNVKSRGTILIIETGKRELNVEGNTFMRNLSDANP
jgi:hypothetical protein